MRRFLAAPAFGRITLYRAGVATRPSPSVSALSGDDHCRQRHRALSPGAVDPASRLRRRYADAPTAALLTGLGPGEWALLRFG